MCLLLLVFVEGCSPLTSSNPNVATDATANGEDESQEVEGMAVSDEVMLLLAGRYYQGDGLGVNLRLNLKKDGQFVCKWTGCAGDYGATSGTWSLDGNRIMVKAIKSRGMFEISPLSNMTVINDEGVTRLLRDSDADFVGKNPRMLANFSFGSTEEMPTQ
jgi:hypothetical protein